VIAGGDLAGEFEPIERRLAGQRRAVFAPRRELARQRRHQRVMAKLVMVIEVFVAERDAEHALPDQRGYAVFDVIRRPPVHKAGGEALDQADGAIGRSQKQPARVRGDRAAVEIGRHPPPFDPPKQIVIRATLRQHRGAPPSPRKSLSQNNFR
jgi:hypothetical protein